MSKETKEFLLSLRESFRRNEWEPNGEHTIRNKLDKKIELWVANGVLFFDLYGICGNSIIPLWWKFILWKEYKAMTRRTVVSKINQPILIIKTVLNCPDWVEGVCFNIDNYDSACCKDSCSEPPKNCPLRKNI